MSISSQSTHQKFPFEYEAVFDAIIASMPQAGFSLKSEDRVIGRITASAGMSLFSWGENLTILVERVDDKTTLVAIESAMKIGMNVAGVHRHAHNFEKLIRAVSSHLQARKPQPAHAAAPAPAPPKPPEVLTIPCPLCSQQLRVTTLKQGENWCPHCFEKFIAE
jgi:hypothetical protein